jgi:hypothetical protein
MPQFSIACLRGLNRLVGLALARRFTLGLCYPLDHWLRLSLPSPQFRTYRIFVLEKQNS